MLQFVPDLHLCIIYNINCSKTKLADWKTRMKRFIRKYFLKDRTWYPSNTLWECVNAVSGNKEDWLLFLIPVFFNNINSSIDLS